jgi:putative component of membrane protein insertase Oxa1/YidC/SpoIIIJ protein YidD
MALLTGSDLRWTSMTGQASLASLGSRRSQTASQTKGVAPVGLSSLSNSYPHLAPHLETNVLKFSGPSQSPPGAQEFLDPNTITYDPKGIYSEDGTLSLGQKVCDFLIRKVYQGPTRSTVYKWFGNPCPYKRKANKLSCSEYTLVMIHRLGVVRGIWEGGKRLLRCNPYNYMMNKHYWHDTYEDPKIRLNAIPWRWLPQI